jgi:hypothetical protein
MGGTAGVGGTAIALQRRKELGASVKSGAVSYCLAYHWDNIQCERNLGWLNPESSGFCHHRLRLSWWAVSHLYSLQILLTNVVDRLYGKFAPT